MKINHSPPTFRKKSLKKSSAPNHKICLSQITNLNNIDNQFFKLLTDFSNQFALRIYLNQTATEKIQRILFQIGLKQRQNLYSLKDRVCFETVDLFDPNFKAPFKANYKCVDSPQKMREFSIH
ncbi:hypothetical protein BpHYR1_002706 [Brachionus plicatilis]|uniref:Uncharacterized protein n=1 Tax=Brachionus plicatilis TaxID=10195 RepID=A0A3M7QIF0_BRAPC|nr:hypothetical protein BpHYR1_002706 [Brachionus plicatilis]